MPTRKKEVQKERKQPDKDGKSGSYLAIAIIIVIVAVAAVLGYIVSTGLGGSHNQNFESFQSNFYTAQRVVIFVTYLNGSTFSYADGCASNLIESMTSSRAHHRNMSTIDLRVIANSTSCLAPSGSLGSSNGTRIIPIADCLALSANEPSVFINYSSTNSTVVKLGNLYTQGDALFLSECGISPELG